MRPRMLLVLSLLVAGLAGFIWLVESDLPGTDERAEQAKKLLLFDPQLVTRVTVERGEELVVLERSAESEWNLVEPVAARADGAAVEGVLDQLAALEKERTFDDAEAEELGLRPPRAAVSLSGAEGERQVFIGGDVPASDSMIAAVAPTGPFHVVARDAWSGLDLPAEAWRERTVFPGLRGDIERLVLIRGGERVEIAKREDEFFLEAPLIDRADEGTIARFLDALVGLEVAEFVDDDQEPDEGLGFASPERTLAVSTRGSANAWKLELGRGKEGDEADESLLYVRAGGHVYVVPDTVSESFELAAEEWRSLEWTGRQVHEIDRLEVRDERGTMTLERDAGDWRRDGVKIEYGPVSDLLYALAGTKGEALDAEQAIAGDPLLSMTINPGDSTADLEGDGESANVLVVEVFAPTGDLHPATASDRQTALWLGGDRVRGIVSNVAAVRGAPALAEEAESDDSGQAPPDMVGTAADQD